MYATSKLSFKPTISRCLENAHRSLCKLKWLRSGRTVSKQILRRFFFSYVFPHLASIFSFFFLSQTQQEALRGKFRVAIQLVHRAPYVGAANLFTFTGEEPLNNYVTLLATHSSSFSSFSSFCNENPLSTLFFESYPLFPLFFWSWTEKRKYWTFPVLQQ